MAPTPTPTAAPVDKLAPVAGCVELVVDAASVEEVDVEEAVEEAAEVEKEEDEEGVAVLDTVAAVALDITNTSVVESVSSVCSSQTAMENSGDTERSLVVFTVQVKFVAPIWSSVRRCPLVAVQAIPCENKTRLRVMYSKGPSV